MDDAVEILAGAGPVVMTCEHASVRMPSPWAWPEADRWLVGTHWSYDLGVADLIRAVHDRTGWAAVLSRFTRLLVDPNRPVEHPELFRSTAEGRVIHLNAGVSAAERKRRIEALYVPYEAAVDQVVEAAEGAVVMSLHSFTPVYEGKRRALEIGVLFDEDEDTAGFVARSLSDAGWSVRLNEPYSGRAGLMYAAARPARKFGRTSIELEVRQDLLMEPDRIEQLAADIEAAARLVAEG